jgi:hypothetical protein
MIGPLEVVPRRSVDHELDDNRPAKKVSRRLWNVMTGMTPIAHMATVPTLIILKALLIGIAHRDCRFEAAQDSDRLPARSGRARPRTSCQWIARIGPWF